DLANVCKVALGVKLDKAVRDEMKGVRFEELGDEEQRRVQEYCLADSLNTKRLVNTLGEMSPIEDAIAEHTRMVNRRGVHVDVEMVDRNLERLHRVREEAISRLPWAEDSAPLSYDAFSEYCRMHKVDAPSSLDKRDQACISWMQQNPKLGELVLA